MNVIFFRAHTDTDILVGFTRRTAVIDFLMIRLRVVDNLAKKLVLDLAEGVNSGKCRFT